MRIKILFLTLIIVCIATSTKSFSQIKNSSTELKKIATNLIECFYIVKESSVTNLSDCSTQLKERISELSTSLHTKVDQNKTFVTQKIGADNFKELQTFIQKCNDYSESNEELTADQRSSLMFWISLWKDKIEEIFIKLNK